MRRDRTRISVVPSDQADTPPVAGDSATPPASLEHVEARLSRGATSVSGRRWVETRVAPRLALHDLLQEYISRASEAQAPLALLLVAPELRRPTGQRLDRRTEARLLDELAGITGRCLHHADRVLPAGDGILAIVLRGAGEIGVRGIEKRLRRRFDAIEVLAGRDVRVAARVGWAVFPDDGLAAPDVIRCAQDRVTSARLDALP